MCSGVILVASTRMMSAYNSILFGQIHFSLGLTQPQPECRMPVGTCQHNGFCTTVLSHLFASLALVLLLDQRESIRGLLISAYFRVLLIPT